MSLSHLEHLINNSGKSPEEIAKELSNQEPKLLPSSVEDVDLKAKSDPANEPAPVQLIVEPPLQQSNISVNTLSDEEKVKADSEGEQLFRSFRPDPTKILKPDGFDFEDPFELLLFLDDDVAKGKKNGGVDLHPWQIQIMLDFAKGGITDEFPFQALVRACNGSGKDKYVIAPCAVWLCMRYCMSRCVITSASGDQLDNQTDAYIYQLCLAANRKIHPNVWKLNYRYYECLATQSPMKLFATDEPGKAEGYHPLGNGKKMAIFMSEAKSIPDEINVAINKCTGYTHRVHVSTPGLPLGHFFDYCNMSVLRNTFKDVYDVKPIDYIQYHITAFQCSHLSRNYIEQCKRDLPGGENGAAYKSQVLAEFGTTDEMVVIPYTYIWQALNSPCAHIPEAHNTGGLDLSDGGDETSLCVRNGNKQIKMIPFRFDNTEDTIDFLDQKFRENNLDHPDALIFADVGGLGKPMLNRLKRLGWHNIRFVDNRQKAYQPKVYKNRNSEVWFHTRLLFERKEIIPLRDDVQTKQLTTRYYKIVDGRVHQMLTKLEQKSKGYPSPDRADAFNLCFWNYKSTYVEVPENNKAPFEPKEQPKPTTDFDIRVWAKQGDSDQLPNPSRGKDFTVLQRAVTQYNKQLEAQNN